MKKINLTIALCGVFVGSVFSQINFQVTGGVSPQSKRTSAGLIVNRQSPHEEFVFNMNESGPQYFGGIKANIVLKAPFFVNAGVTYTKAKYNYLLKYTMIDAEHPVSDYVMTGTEHLLSLPVNIGVHLGSFDITSGLKMIKSVSARTELNQLQGFLHENKFLRLGWQGSIGYNVFDTRLGIEFDSQFSRIGKGMFVNDQSLELMRVPGQFIFTIQRNL